MRLASTVLAFSSAILAVPILKGHLSSLILSWKKSIIVPTMLLPRMTTLPIWVLTTSCMSYIASVGVSGAEQDIVMMETVHLSFCLLLV